MSWQSLIELYLVFPARVGTREKYCSVTRSCQQQLDLKQLSAANTVPACLPLKP